MFLDAQDYPKNRSWITKVCISSSRTEEIQKISHHP